MSEANVLDFFEDYGLAIEGYWIDVAFGAFLLLSFIIGMLLGAFRGAWFFFTSMAFFAIGWATSNVVGQELYPTVFKENYSELYNSVNELKKMGIDLQPPITEFIGLIYIFVLVGSCLIVISLPLYFFFGKGISQYAKHMSKKKKGLSMFIGGMIGITASILVGFAIFYTGGGMINLTFGDDQMKFKNFYSKVMSYKKPAYKNEINELIRVNALLDVAYEPNSNNDATYSQLIRRIFMEDDTLTNVETLSEVDNAVVDEQTVLNNLEKIFVLNLNFLLHSNSIDEYLNLLNIYGYEKIFFEESNLNLTNKKAFLVDWLKEFPVILTRSGFGKVGEDLIVNAVGSSDPTLDQRIWIYERAGEIIIKISERLQDEHGTNGDPYTMDENNLTKQIIKTWVLEVSNP